MKDYGAVGDGVTDDTPAVERAIQAASAPALSDPKGSVVYFPPASRYYNLASPLSLPFANKWMTLYLDAAIQIHSTLDVPSYYAIIGDSGGGPQGFSKRPLAFIGVTADVNPGISIVGKHDIILENFSIGYMENGADGIEILPVPMGKGASAWITIKNVHVDTDANNITGIPLTIKGGFGYYITDGGYGVPAGSTSPGILIEDDPLACDNTGIVRVDGAFLANRGIELRSRCGILNSMIFKNILMEEPVTALLTINQVGPGGSWDYNIDIEGVNMADALYPGPPIVEAHGGQIYSVTISHSMTDWGNIAQGDTIHGLEVWWPVDAAFQGISQKTDYILHTPSHTISTIPVISLVPSGQEPAPSPDPSGGGPAGHRPDWPRGRHGPAVPGADGPRE